LQNILIMADLDRNFKKKTVANGGVLLNLIEGDVFNGSPDGPLLKLDGPVFKIIAIRVLADYEDEPPFNIIPASKRVEIELLYTAKQGSLVRPDSRFFTFYYADLPTGAKNKVRDFYNWVTDSLIKVLPELADGVEQ